MSSLAEGGVNGSCITHFMGKGFVTGVILPDCYRIRSKGIVNSYYNWQGCVVDGNHFSGILRLRSGFGNYKRHGFTDKADPVLGEKGLCTHETRRTVTAFTGHYRFQGAEPTVVEILSCEDGQYT
jgi:hypothetical protein